MEPYEIEADYFFVRNGANSMRDVKPCGSIVMNIYSYENGVIDKVTKLPKYLGWGWNKISGFSAPYISLQTDDESDIGEHYFIMCFTIPGYDPAILNLP